jgi:hypothetical protein
LRDDFVRPDECDGWPAGGARDSGPEWQIRANGLSHQHNDN